MQFLKNKRLKYILLCLILFSATYVHARLGGGGGSDSGSSGLDGGGDSDGGGDGLFYLVYMLFRILGWKGVIVVGVGYLIYQRFFAKKSKNSSDTFSGNQFAGYNAPSSVSFPDGLDEDKVTTAFLEMQNAWKEQDLGKVRKWMTDGLYQKLSVQIAMMQKLGQHNKTDNIRIINLNCVNTYSFRDFHIADIRIDFVLNDSFYSDKYKSMNESYTNDSATEYFTFIRKGYPTDNDDIDLYSDNNCPNCGATLENKMGEICRCSNCNSLTNNPEFDWVLSEITQSENYSKESNLNYNETLLELTQFDDEFNIQTIEDIASNITMQILDVITGGKEIKLERFAEKDIEEYILDVKKSFKGIVFDRLYLNEVTTRNFQKVDDKLVFDIYVEATGKRVIPEGDNLNVLDYSFRKFTMNLSLTKTIMTVKREQTDVVYSYECPSCAAPYDDTTHDTCNYCDAVVVDPSRNWILSNFTIQL